MFVTVATPKDADSSDVPEFEIGQVVTLVVTLSCCVEVDTTISVVMFAGRTLISVEGVMPSGSYEARIPYEIPRLAQPVSCSLYSVHASDDVAKDVELWSKPWGASNNRVLFNVRQSDRTVRFVSAGPSEPT